MLRRFGILGMFIAALMALSMATALAAGGQANGTGKTHNGASLGFNAKADLTGNFEYQSADGSLNIHCNDYDMFEIMTTTAGFPLAWFSSTNCYDKGGVQYKLIADLIDRGEGHNALRDGGHIVFKRLSDGMKVIIDVGHIQKGNIQIHV